MSLILNSLSDKKEILFTHYKNLQLKRIFFEFILNRSCKFIKNLKNLIFFELITITRAISAPLTPKKNLLTF